VQDFLARYGLLAVFAAAAVEGDVSVVLAGVLADLGFFSLPRAVEAAWLGGFVGDTAWYVLGRLNSAAVRRSRLYLRAAPLIERLVARLGEREIVLSRFVYGTRIASMFFWGVHGLPYGRFAAFDLVGCLLSAWGSASARARWRWSAGSSGRRSGCSPCSWRACPSCSPSGT